MHTHRPTRTLWPVATPLIGLLTMVIPITAVANRNPTVVRWVDAQGQTHFSDRVPAEAQGATVEVTVNPDRNVVPAPPMDHFVPFKPARPKRSRSDRSAHAVKTKRCARDQEQLQRLHDRMLAGYKARQYNGLMQRKRKLEERAAADCH